MIFGIVLAVSLLVLDAYLRLAEIQTPMETRIDADIGPTYIAGKHVTRFNEGFYLGSINEYGYLGPGRPPRKENDEFRVILLGDSYVMGITVFSRHHFGMLLENQLSDQGNREFQVLNFGKADFNLSNMYAYYENFASEFEHDLVLFFVGSGDLVPAGQIEKDLYPSCELEGEDVVISNAFRNSQKFATYQRLALLSGNSALFRLAYNTRKMIARGELPELVFEKLSPILFPPAVAATDGNKPNSGREMSDLFRAILRQLARDPRNVMVQTKELPDHVRAELDAAGLPVWDIASLLGEMKDQGQDPYYWSVTGKRGHWNHEAHRAIAAKLAEDVMQFFGASHSSED